MTLGSFLIIGAAVVAVSVLIGWIAWKISDKIDDWEDETQRHINRIENQFAAAGVTGWFATFLEDLVVGDEEAVVRDARQMLEAQDTAEFFLKEVGLPVALYAIRASRADYPDLYAKLETAMAQGKPATAVAAPAAAS